MSAPDITVDIRTANAAGLLYARLAATAANGALQGVVGFVVDVTNNGPAAVTLDELRVDFPGAPAVPAHVIPMTRLDDGVEIPVVVQPGQTRTWWNQPANNLFLTVPPAQARVAVSCEGFSDAVATTLPLVAHAGGPSGKGYRFPGRRSDLAKNEYWYGRTGTHGAAGGGNQLYAYDLVAIGWNASSNKWSRLVDGTDESADRANKDYRIYGKQVVAMAAGTVVAFLDGMAENTPGERNPNPVEGNHLYVQHGTELALYAHFQPGTIPDALLQAGATVEAGQVLGRVGNSGNSSEPHLHLHVIEGSQPWQGPPRPLHFRSFAAQAKDNLTAAPDNTGWVEAKGAALPRPKSAIRPPAPARRPEPTLRKPDLRDVPVLVGETSPGVANGAGGTITLPGGRRKPVSPR